MRLTLKTTSSAVSGVPSWNLTSLRSVELDRRVVDLLPGGRDLRHDLARGVARDQVVEDVAIDAVAVGVPLQMRIERRRIVRRVDGQGVFRGSARWLAPQAQAPRMRSLPTPAWR